MKKALRIFRLVEFSTAHISKQDDKKLRDQHSEVFTPTAYECGYLVPVVRGDVNQILLQEGFTPEFCRIYTLAWYVGAGYIQFDRDGAEYPDMRTFDW